MISKHLIHTALVAFICTFGEALTLWARAIHTAINPTNIGTATVLDPLWIIGTATVLLGWLCMAGKMKAQDIHILFFFAALRGLKVLLFDQHVTQYPQEEINFFLVLKHNALVCILSLLLVFAYTWRISYRITTRSLLQSS